jgi:anti-sigma regulatory factor (Ser/Thr protein kinase)
MIARDFDNDQPESDMALHDVCSLVSYQRSSWRVAQFEKWGNEVEQPVQTADEIYPLEVALSNVRREIAAGGQAKFWIVSEGRAAKLRPVIQHEAYWIAREALVNAFRHSGATRVQLQIAYTSKELRLIVGDDGKGIPPQVLSLCDRRTGLFAMQARAEKIGAKLRLLSRLAGGTEVELTIPREIAFEPQSKNPRLSLVSYFRSRISANDLRTKKQ